MTRIFTLVSISALFLLACTSVPELKEPRFREDVNVISQKLADVSTFTKVNFAWTSSTESGYNKTSSDLKVTLSNGEFLPETKEGTDSLARHIATVVRKSIDNANDFDWITVVFEPNDHSGESGDLSSRVFTYRPDELR